MIFKFHEIFVISIHVYFFLGYIKGPKAQRGVSIHEFAYSIYSGNICYNTTENWLEAYLKSLRYLVLHGN